jgi:D-amino-acid oxidase
MSHVIVVGAGVIGLSCAVRLAEAGHRVEVVTRDDPGETTSSVSAALWFPYLALPRDRVTAWSAASYEEFLRLPPESGVRVRQGAEVLSEPSPDPWWAAAVPSFERLAKIPPGYADGWTFPAPVIDMGVYLPYLVARLTSLGGSLTRRDLDALPDAPLVVNCSGLGARTLAGDPSLTPIRGQIMLLEQIGLTEWRVDDTDPERPCYVVPRLNDIVIGGTAQPGDWNDRADPETARTIRSRAENLVPELRAARTLRHRVGLRPARPTVRLEAEQRSGGTVVHCYGHGGAGVTLSWGCAAEVTALITQS